MLPVNSDLIQEFLNENAPWYRFCFPTNIDISSRVFSRNISEKNHQMGVNV